MYLFAGESYMESPFGAVAENALVVGTAENISRKIKAVIRWGSFGKQKVLPW